MIIGHGVSIEPRPEALARVVPPEVSIEPNPGAFQRPVQSGLPANPGGDHTSSTSLRSLIESSQRQITRHSLTTRSDPESPDPLCAGHTGGTRIGGDKPLKQSLKDKRRAQELPARRIADPTVKTGAPAITFYGSPAWAQPDSLGGAKHSPHHGLSQALSRKRARNTLSMDEDVQMSGSDWLAQNAEAAMPPVEDGRIMAPRARRYERNHMSEGGRECVPTAGELVTASIRAKSHPTLSDQPVWDDFWRVGRASFAELSHGGDTWPQNKSTVTDYRHSSFRAAKPLPNGTLLDYTGDREKYILYVRLTSPL